ncbi:MAG: hypothetical protein ACI93R_002072 [Flavobacteriales bacterium]|jgi:hypothetical protein
MNRMTSTLKHKSALLVIGVLLANSVYSRELNIAHSNISTTYGNYPKELLALALSYSKNEYSVKSPNNFIPYERCVARITSGKLDVMWAPASVQNEIHMRPIHIPIFKGLLGHRIFIINKASQGDFDAIREEDALKATPLGQVRAWSDSRILEHNGYNVIRIQRYEDVFPMLRSKRFTAFPRGIFEPWVEIDNIQHLELKAELAVEKTLMLKYPMPLYYYVNKGDDDLARDIKQGLERAITNGEFDKLFYGDKKIHDVFEKSNFKSRKVFELKNPYLPEGTPLDRSELWLSTDLK